jgi:hypothetical protein
LFGVVVCSDETVVGKKGEKKMGDAERRNSGLAGGGQEL